RGGAGVVRRGAGGAQADRARVGSVDGEGEALRARRVRAAAQGEPGVGPAAEGDRRGGRRHTGYQRLMRWQLRMYRIQPGRMDDWVDEWRAHVRPLRESMGFTVLGP